MYERIRKDLDGGIEKVKWFAGLLSERVRIELTVFRLLHEAEEQKKRRDMLLKKIGEDFYQMHKSGGESNPNQEMLDAINEIDDLEARIKETLEKASEISRTSS